MFSISFRKLVLVASLLLIAPLCAAETYVLGAGDVVRISVFGQDDLETTQRIADDGTISFPLVGEIKIAGLTERQLERKVADQLVKKKIVRAPQVTVIIEEFLSQRVSILGKVAKPGVYSVARGERITEIIAQAGGLTEDAGDFAVVTRKGAGDADPISVDLQAVLQKGDASADIALMNGDRVFVPEMSLFYIYGQVEQPDGYRFKPGMTVMEAISVAGGLTDIGTERGLTLRRKTTGDEIETIKVDITDRLQEGDVVYVKESLF